MVKKFWSKSFNIFILWFYVNFTNILRNNIKWHKILDFNGVIRNENENNLEYFVLGYIIQINK